MKTIFKNGTYERVSEEVADYEVKVGNAQYASKKSWKENVRDIVKVKAETVVEAEQKGEHTKSKKAIKSAKLKSKQRQ
jgi:hypothetical protein